MSFTNKHEFELLDYGTQNWHSILNTNFQSIDNDSPNYLRYRIASGEIVTSGQPLCIISGEFFRAYDDGSNKIPPVAVAYEDSVSGEYLIGKYHGVYSNSTYSLNGSGEVYLDASGELTHTIGSYKIGVSITGMSLLLKF